MKKGLVIGLLVGVVVSLASFLVIPVFAQGGGGRQTDPGWQDMHNACQSGDWDAMRDAAQRYHGADFDSMPCGNGTAGTGTGGATPRPRGTAGGMMGGGGWGGMMGGGWGTW